MWAWLWFGAFLCALAYIGLLMSRGVVTPQQAQDVLGEEAKKVEDATSALVQKAKETIKKAKEKP